MILLDTNVVSEPLKPGANPAVAAWLDRQIAETLFLSTVSFSELLVGVAVLPEGKRKKALHAGLNELMVSLFGPRILPFDIDAARAYAILAPRARGAGQTIALADGQIAAIAAAHDFTVATRDTAPFAAAGVRVINPWLEGA